jgi:hypothetical protein
MILEKRKTVDSGVSLSMGFLEKIEGIPLFYCKGAPERHFQVFSYFNLPRGDDFERRLFTRSAEENHRSDDSD